jgi:hypothetical protein
MIDRLMKMIAGWKGYALTAGVCLAIGAASGWTVRDWKAGSDAAAAAKAEAEETRRTLNRERGQSDLTTSIETEAVKAQVEIRWRTQTLIREVPVYVTSDADTRCIVPVGFVRIHDAAASGNPLPEPSGLADDAPSGVAISAAAATIIANYGQYDAVSRQLTDLQKWVREQQALTNDPRP